MPPDRRLPSALAVALGLSAGTSACELPRVGPCLEPAPVDPVPVPVPPEAPAAPEPPVHPCLTPVSPPPVPLHPCLSPVPVPVPPPPVPVHACLSVAPEEALRPPPTPPAPAETDGGASLDDVLGRLPQDVAARLRQEPR